MNKATHPPRQVVTVSTASTDLQLGGYDWTWEEKQRCISICTDALYQIVSHLIPEHLADIQGWGKLAPMSNEGINTDR